MLGVGCGPKTGTVSGKISVNGKPLSKGMISFFSEVGKRDIIRAQIVDGAFKTEPISAGPAKIAISPALVPPEEGKGNDLIAPKKKGRAPAEVPEKYNDPGTSSLEMTIKGGENDFTKDLTP